MVFINKGTDFLLEFEDRSTFSRLWNMYFIVKCYILLLYPDNITKKIRTWNAVLWASFTNHNYRFQIVGIPQQYCIFSLLFHFFNLGKVFKSLFHICLYLFSMIFTDEVMDSTQTHILHTDFKPRFGSHVQHILGTFNSWSYIHMTYPAITIFQAHV